MNPIENDMDENMNGAYTLMRNASRRCVIITLAAWSWLGAAATPGPAAEGGHLHFLAIAGSPVAGKTPVLLRWFSFDGSIPVDTFSIFRKAGEANSAQPMELVSVTARLRNAPLIRSIFEQPAVDRAKVNLLEMLDSMLDEPVTDDTYVDQLLTILDGDPGCAQCEFRARMLVNANYGVAIVEGLGYLDLVDPQTYTYELRSSQGTGGTDDLVLGRVTIDAAVPTKLAAPQQPVRVNVPGEKGHLKIFLKWDFSPALRDQRQAFFGYNVYRGEGDLSGQNFNSLMSQGLLQKINPAPVLPPSQNALGSQPEDQYVFVDDNMALDESGPVGDPFDPGAVYTYWVAPIDLLGQEGEVSPPVTATANDQSAPDVPRGLSTKVADVSGIRRIVLTWDRNPDDAIGYRVYRFREWDHVGKKDPFPPVNGLPEGYITDIPQPAADNPFFLDTTINIAQHENQAFWYCVSAFDAAGNESALSPPFRGVIFDKQPPGAPPTVDVCTLITLCDLFLESVTPEPNRIPETRGNLVVELIIARRDSNTSPLRIVVERITQTIASTVNLPPVIEAIFDGPYPADEKLVIPDEFPKPPRTVRVYYQVTVWGGDVEPCAMYQIPDAKWFDFYDRYLLEGISMTALLSLSTETYYRCRPGQVGTLPHDPFDDTGRPRPVTFQVPQADDAVGVILYRSPDCDNYFPVAEQRFNGANQLTLEDYFTPSQGGRICYGVRYFDENNNRGPIFYIPTQFLFPSLPDSNVTPSMISATPLGDETAPSFQLKWFGSNVGLAGFRIEMATTDKFEGKLATFTLSPDDYSFDAEDNEFETVIDREDEATNAKIQINQKYFIRAVALRQNGEERVSNNSLPFLWAADVTPHEHPAWPIRPLPPTDSKLKAGWMPAIVAAEPTPFSYGVVLWIGTLDFSGRKETNAEYFIKPPFIVYRKRLDLPGRTYVQISPLIDSISAPYRDVPQDPFVISRAGTFDPDHFPELANTPGIFYLDTTDLILGAKYEYKIVKLDPNTGEIEKVFGPSNPVEVLNP